MDTTLTQTQIDRMAKGVPQKSLQAFYANPANQKAFREWKEKKERRTR